MAVTKLPFLLPRQQRDRHGASFARQVSGAVAGTTRRPGDAKSPSPNGMTAPPRVDEAPSPICSGVEPTGVGRVPDELDGDARLRLGIAVGVYPDVDVTVEVGVPTDLTGRCESALVVEIDEGEVLQSSVIGEGPEVDLIALPRVEVPDHILIPSKPRGHSGLGNAVPVKGVRPEAAVQYVNAGAAHDCIVAGRRQRSYRRWPRQRANHRRCLRTTYRCRPRRRSGLYRRLPTQYLGRCQRKPDPRRRRHGCGYLSTRDPDPMSRSWACRLLRQTPECWESEEARVFHHQTWAWFSPSVGR